MNRYLAYDKTKTKNLIIRTESVDSAINFCEAMDYEFERKISEREFIYYTEVLFYPVVNLSRQRS